ncbi:MAG: hypothetical protein QW130_02515 [Sulfolobales archaeon]
MQKLYKDLREIVDEWCSTVAVKNNIIEALVKGVKKVKEVAVGIGAVTGPYQPVEALYRLTRKAVEIQLNMYSR